MPESESRVLEIEVETLGGHPHLVAGDALHRPGLFHYHLNGARIEMGMVFGDVQRRGRPPSAEIF